ncbi:MAG TPA: histidine phosphatase family protein [Solimonas sp.]
MGGYHPASFPGYDHGAHNAASFTGRRSNDHDMGAIYLIRHGQASFGAADYDKLSELGHEQGRVLGASLRTRVLKHDLVICGGMRRHRETADNCLRAMDREALWEDDAGWAEYDHEAVVNAYRPSWADKQAMKADLSTLENPRRAFQEIFERAIARWVGGEHEADYPESWTAFRARVEDALTRLRQRLGKSQTALVFTSGGPITAVVQHLMQLPDDRAFRLNWTLANCGITKLIYSDRGVYVSSVNEHACFEGAQARLITYR